MDRQFGARQGVPSCTLVWIPKDLTMENKEFYAMPERTNRNHDEIFLDRSGVFGMDDTGT